MNDDDKVMLIVNEVDDNDFSEEIRFVIDEDKVTKHPPSYSCSVFRYYSKDSSIIYSPRNNYNLELTDKDVKNMIDYFQRYLSMKEDN